MIRLTPEQQVFVTERHLATLTTLRPDGSPHVVPVAFTWDPERGVALVTAHGGSVKVRNVEHPGAAPAVLCQVDRGRWLSLEGVARVRREPEEVRRAERRHAVRYPPLDPDPERVVLEVAVRSVLGSSYMT